MGSTQRAHGPITAEEFAAMGDLGRAELVDGEVVEMPPVGGTHGGVAGNVYYQIRRYLDATGHGRAVLETGFVLARDPDIVRAPDVAFIAADRLPDGRLPEGFFEGAPDVAVEVLSPGDRMADVERKIDEYLHAGARAVWIINPQARHVTVYEPGVVIRRFRSGDTLTADSLPDFTCPVADLFD